jgi:O-antigen ligase
MRARDASAPRGTRSDAVVAAFISAALLASWLALDPKSIDAFDAPKVVLVATALAAAAVVALFGRIARAGLAAARLSLPSMLLIIGLVGTSLSALASVRRGASLDALRLALVFLLALPLGASAAYARHRGKLVSLFASAAVVNALLVLLAAARIYAPIVVYGETQREGLGALVGNAGYAGIGLAIAAVTLIPFAISPGGFRPLAIAALALVLAGTFATESLSGIAVAASGIAVYGALAGGRRARRILAAIVAAVFLLAAAYAPVRHRAIQFFRAARQREWNAAFTARAAPWLAAGEMIRAHPVLGIGVGTFRSEYIAARIAAETRIRRQLVLTAMRTNSFAQAHNDYLDILAGSGVPAGLCVIFAYGTLLAAVWRRARVHRDAAGVSALLAGGAVAAFAWFPFQIVPTALWLLLECGRADRLAREES